MHSEKLLDHFQNPRHVGELPAPARTVEVMNPVCGDILRLSVRWEGDVAAEVGYKARGCTAAIGAGSILTELIAGRGRGEISALDAQAIDEAAGGLRAESKHAAVLCADALRALLKA